MTHSHDPLKQQLKSTFEPRKDLTASILQRIKDESQIRDDQDDELEEALEALLRRWPVEGRKEFAVETLRRAQAAPFTRGHGWQGLIQTVGFLAACLGVAFVLPKSIETPSQAAAPSTFVAANNPINEEIAMLLALAEDLPQTTRWLIEEAPLLTLVSERP